MSKEIVFARTSPEAQGISSTAIQSFVDSIEAAGIEMHSLMLVRHGNVVAEGWWTPYAAERQHVLFSLSKSFTSTAAGLAVHEGLLGLDDLVISYFPDYLPTVVSDNLGKMRVRDLLSMSTGHSEDTLPGFFRNKMTGWESHFLAMEVAHEPGTHFLYNSGATYMVASIVTKVTGMSLTEYLTPRLFEPLGIVDPWWEKSPTGVDVGGWGLNIRTEDIAKFGQLYLQKGRWGDRQLIPESWVDTATSSHISNGDNPESEWNQGYGFQFWMCRHNAYRGDGAFGQFCVVMPEQDAVFAATGGTGDLQGVLNRVWEHLLPSMSAVAKDEDPAALAAMRSRLGRLKLPIVDGRPNSPYEDAVSGKTYLFDENEDGWKSVTATFVDGACDIEIDYGSGIHSIPIAGTEWSEVTVDVSAGDVNGPYPCAVSGAWVDPKTYVVKLCSYLTPFSSTFEFRFDEGGGMTLDRRLNVSFGPVERKQLVAR